MPKTKTHLVGGDLSYAVNTDGFWRDIENYSDLWALRYDGANWMQIEQRWLIIIAQTVPYLEQRNWKQQVLRRKQRNLKNGKVRFRLNIDVRKEMEDSRSVLGKTVPEVLLESEGTVFPNMDRPRPVNNIFVYF